MSQDMKRSFCVPYNGDIDLVRWIVRDHSEYVHEFYGADDVFASGRNASFCTPAPIENVMRELEGSGIRFNYLLNSFLVDDYVAHLDQLVRHVERLRELGVQTVTAASPYFIDLLKKRGFEVSTSMMQNIATELSLRYHEELGYDRIIVSEDELRNVPNLARLAKATSLRLEVLINNCCLRECPFRATHYNAEAMRGGAVSEKSRQHVSAFCRQCKEKWYADPSSFMKSSWVRPQELRKYKEIGIALFKITGRAIPSSSVLKMLQIYQSGEWHGSAWDFLKPFADPVELYGIEHFNSASLDGFFDFFFKHGCDGGCSDCRHCEKWGNKVIKLRDDHCEKLRNPKGASELV